MSQLQFTDPEVYDAIEKELHRETHKIELIASENFVSPSVLEACGSVMTNKYAEGYPHRRYYGGCEYVDIVEDLAIERAKKLFGAEHVNVQPHSGSQANMAVYFAMLETGDKILSLDLSHGGHLTHGSPVNFSGKFYEIIPYGVEKETGTIDYDKLSELASVHKPKLIVAGASAYPRTLDFEAFRKIADSAGAFLMVDIAHIAGLVATGLHPSPLALADFVTTTTHKTLRGPRGGMIMCKEIYAKKIDKMIFPGIQGGPLMHIIAAKAVALKEALDDNFKAYQERIIKNAKVLAQTLSDAGFDLVSGGTDTHLMLIDLRNKKLTGKVAEKALDQANITVNKNTVPFETESPFVSSGIRLGTPAVTTRGMGEKEMDALGGFINQILTHLHDGDIIHEVSQKVTELSKIFPYFFTANSEKVS